MPAIWVVRIMIGGFILWQFYAQSNPCSYWNWFGYECTAEIEVGPQDGYCPDASIPLAQDGDCFN